MSAENNRLVFARNLTHYIERSGRTQKEIAEYIGVATSTFNDWATGKRYPRMGKIEMLANYFGILKSDLIEDKKEKPTVNDGLSKNKRALMEFVQSVPEEKAEKVLRLMQAILEADS